VSAKLGWRWAVARLMASWLPPPRRDKSRNGVPRARLGRVPRSPLRAKTAVIARRYRALEPDAKLLVLFADALDGVLYSALHGAASPVDRRLRPARAPSPPARPREL